MKTDVIRLRNPVISFDVTYDGVDSLFDTGWLAAVVPRIAQVLGVDWSIVDNSVTPPETIRSAANAADLAASDQ